MGDFHNVVTALLDAFAQGISIIKTQRKRRKAGAPRLDSAQKAAETDLQKSFKSSQNDIASAYGRDLALHGSGFAIGDDEAHSSLSTILFRLNAAFVSVIQKFTRGQSSPSDYRALVNLSNASRRDAIDTFEQLSSRISRTSLAVLPTAKGHSSKRVIGRPKKNSTSHSKPSRSKSAPELSSTALGPATSTGWVRPKNGRQHSLGSTRTIRRSSANQHSHPISEQSCTTARAEKPPAQQKLSDAQKIRGNRKSIMSFASDSTNLGEIPEHKWTRTPAFRSRDDNYPVKTYHPLEPYQEPEKERSRFMRLFKK